MKNLWHARLGTIRYNEMGLYSTEINLTSLRDLIGPEIESMNMLQQKMDAISTTELKVEGKRVSHNREYPLGKPEDEVIEKAVRI